VKPVQSGALRVRARRILFLAFVLAPLWLLLHRLWLALISMPPSTSRLASLGAGGRVVVGTYFANLLIALLVGHGGRDDLALDADQARRQDVGFASAKTPRLPNGASMPNGCKRAEAPVIVGATGAAIRHAGAARATRAMTSSACFPNRERRDECPHRRLRLGNLHSAAKASNALRVNRVTTSDAVTNDPEKVASATAWCCGRRRLRRLPARLDEIPGMIDALEQMRAKKRPAVLRICVGMQLDGGPSAARISGDAGIG